MSQVFEAVERCEAVLGKQRYICGNTFTEADVRLFVTLIRFDEVFLNLLSCFLNHINPFRFLTLSFCCVAGLRGSLQMQQETLKRVSQYLQLHKRCIPNQ